MRSESYFFSPHHHHPPPTAVMISMMLEQRERWRLLGLPTSSPPTCRLGSSQGSEGWLFHHQPQRKEGEAMASFQHCATGNREGNFASCQPSFFNRKKPDIFLSWSRLLKFAGASHHFCLFYLWMFLLREKKTLIRSLSQKGIKSSFLSMGIFEGNSQKKKANFFF